MPRRTLATLGLLSLAAPLIAGKILQSEKPTKVGPKTGKPLEPLAPVSK